MRCFFVVSFYLCSRAHSDANRNATVRDGILRRGDLLLIRLCWLGAFEGSGERLTIPESELSTTLVSNNICVSHSEVPPAMVSQTLEEPENLQFTSVNKFRFQGG